MRIKKKWKKEDINDSQIELICITPKEGETSNHPEPGQIWFLGRTLSSTAIGLNIWSGGGTLLEMEQSPNPWWIGEPLT